MRHILFEQSDNYPIAILVKGSALRQNEIYQNYVAPLIALGIPKGDMIAFSLLTDPKGKVKAKEAQEYLATLLPALESIGTKYLLVTDSSYFKILTKVRKVDPHLGYVLPCAIKGHESLQVVLSINYQALIFKPDLQDKLDMSLSTLANHIQGVYREPGQDIIHSAHYPESIQEIADALESLHQYDTLAADIEGFSLRFNEAGIGTIAFAWDQHNGIAFACDYKVYEPQPEHIFPGGIAPYGSYVINHQVRALLKNFFTHYKGRIRWHNASYDLKAIIFSLWMKEPLDHAGMLGGIEIMTRLFDDTKVVAYLALNSTAGNVLGLKSLAHTFAGNWAQDEIEDIRKIPLSDLLQYNLVDCLCTNYVYDTHFPTMVEDKQHDLYERLMLPTLKVIIQMELVGMPMDPEQIQRLREGLEATRDKHLKLLNDGPIIRMLNLLLQTTAMETANAKLKTKQHPLEHFGDITFNPNSPQQVQRLLYEMMQLPVIDKTKTGQPATGGDTLEKLINHTDVPEYKEIINALIEFTKVDKILGTFVPAFERGIDKADGMKYLHGSFNLGGTVSGRLSSSDPNMQNIPANSSEAKRVKEAFCAPPGWLFVGADFASLEDRINALLTKDPNKLKVYTDGYDGHSLRAFAYFKEQLPDIVDTVESINSIKKAYEHLRQESKEPTFLLTYGGSWIGLMRNLGWSEEKAKRIESNYQSLYQVSLKWVQKKIDEAAKKGYAEGAFGLRIRTPLLHQSLMGTSITPREAQAEARTLGNAISGQSYGQLTNRAAVEFMEKVWKSKYRLDILPVAMIHDAIYLLIRDDVQVVEWTNRELIKAMSWQELPEIQHPDVHLGAELDIFWPNWNNGITLPNNASAAQIKEICFLGKDKFLNPDKYKNVA